MKDGSNFGPNEMAGELAQSIANSEGALDRIGARLTV